MPAWPKACTPPQADETHAKKSLVPPPKSPIRTVAGSVRGARERVPAASGSSADHLGEAGVGVGAAQAVGAQDIVRELAGEADRAADDDPWATGTSASRAGRNRAIRRSRVKGWPKIRVSVKLLLRQVGLHRHDQPAVQRILEIGVDRLGAGGDRRMRRAAVSSVQKHRTERNTSPSAWRCAVTLPSPCSSATTLLVVPKSMPIA